MNGGGLKKLLDRTDLDAVLAPHRAAGKVIGFTSGVFDLLHAGHVSYLQAARERCDVLVVAINDDASVRANKGPERPIVGALDRARVVAALAAVDFVFIFSETNNRKNIELLKPTVYLKAGDYDRSRLSSAGLVESYGGRVEFVPFVGGQSSSSIIERIQNATLATMVADASPEVRPAVFVDRDGTLIEHVEYLHEPEKVRVLPGVFPALASLKAQGFRIIMVTNQPAIGLGYCTKEDFYRVNRVVLKAAREAGLLFDRVYVCPHSEADQCQCRKPATGLIDRAVLDLRIDKSRSFVVGDMTGDVLLAQRSGCRSVLVKTGLAGSDRRYDVQPDITADDLARAAEEILCLTAKK